MVKIPFKTIYLGICAVIMLWLLAAQMIANAIVLLPCLACFLLLTAWAAAQGLAMPVLLFFLPFAPLLKMAPGTISFYTLALLTVYAIYAIKGSRNVSILHFIPALCLLILTLLIKTTSGYSVENSYFLFFVALLLSPFLSMELEKKCDFYWLTVFFVTGIVLAAVTAYMFASNPSIGRYISVNSNLGYLRRSGYHGDPNFYSSQITAALGGVLVLTTSETSRLRRVVMALMAVALLYCGLMSVSKSFWLVTLCLLLFWFIGFMFSRGKITVKIALIFTLVVAMAFLLSTTVFADLVELIMSRFVGNKTLSAFTTKRVDLWVNYLRAFREDRQLLWFGQGYTGILLNGRGSHNSLIQGVYQFGLVGLTLFVVWAVFFVRTLLANKPNRRVEFAQIAILLLGAFGPWLGLDFLFFDELFLFPIYVCAAVHHLSALPHESESEVSPLLR